MYAVSHFSPLLQLGLELGYKFHWNLLLLLLLYWNGWLVLLLYWYLWLWEL